MKISIQKEVLERAVSDVYKAISPRVSLPILSGIKITATKQSISLIGSDSNISIEKIVPLEKNGEELASVMKEGSVVINGKFLNEVVKKLPQKDIEITVDSKNVTSLKSGKSQFNLNGFPAEEYPKLPSIEGETDVSLTAEEIQLLVKQTAFAVSTSEVRPVLTGVNLSFKDVLKIVATDSHRLSSKEMNISLKEERQVTIPAKALVELSRIIESNKNNVDVLITDNQVLFKASNLNFYTRLLDGKYPDTSRLIPTESKTQLKLKVRELEQALKRCAVIEPKNFVVTVEIKDKQVHITSTVSEIGKVEETLEDFEVTGEDLKISFNYKLVLDALSAFGTEHIQVKFLGEQRPFIFVSEEEQSLIQLVLPVRTN
ncbi:MULTISPECIES: DNA polymerase III subunit beta [Bacillus]|uniref:DNA polymerase III subunit beta n=1 Tax=Bacillus TaxID=1386 RepID=UPI000C75A2A9|nr:MULTISPECIES: DNA polymerase III subunit beta [Bacillus]MCP1161397.1 DNA polymerase III subunit beta [Bacillus infantis]PLR70492.1 DNA polymerase III subunit beta [Bacillus sp. UMB0728]